MMRDAFIGLGSNMGQTVAQLRDAVVALDELPGTSVISLSHVYESEPWGVTDQPTYANAVALVRTTLRADQLLEYLQEVEAHLGRRRGARYGPRTIDLDILLFGDEEWTTAELEIPHPRMAERDFVLTPLLAIAPHAKWPDGTQIRPSGELVGRVVADHGRVPETDPDWYAWEALAASLEGPVPAGEESPWEAADAWVEVASASARGAEVDILESKLRAAGIPYELSHRELGDMIGSLSGPSRIMVPAGRAQEAQLALGSAGQVRESVPLSPEDRVPYARPAWFQGTVRVFGWLFAIYWIVRILARGGF